MADPIGKARAASERGARGELREVAHTIKGAARTVGLVALGEEAAGLERDADAAPEAALAARVAELERTSARGVALMLAALEGG